MSQRLFGAGLLWVTPKTDSRGNPIANPTPVMCGTLQEGSVEINFETKQLYGSDSKFPVAIAQGKGSIKGKAKMGEIKASIFSAIVFGQASTDGLSAVNYDTVGEVVATSVAVTIPNDGEFLNDLGVINKSNGRAFKRVASAPAVGEYTVDASTGTYTFAVADVGKVVFINFSYTADVDGAQKGTLVAEPMGYTPTFALDLYIPYAGKHCKLHLYNCVSNKFSLGTKVDDFTMPDFDFEAFADEARNVMDYSLSV